MQFKHPEILYALFLLLIPIFIHLFQLRKFQKVAFTNVAFLKKVTIQTRKSSQLKKWLTLLARLLALACIILAFAQPFSASKTALTIEKETVLYIDNSFSMQLKGSNGSLLQNTLQQLYKQAPANNKIRWFTNNETKKNASIQDFKNEILSVGYTQNQLTLSDVLLKANQLFSKNTSSEKNLVIISDFQQTGAFPKIDNNINVAAIHLKATEINNISIDTAFISKKNTETSKLQVQLSAQGKVPENIPISLFNDGKLMAKTAVNFLNRSQTNNTTTITFDISNKEAFKGKIEINDQNLPFDNTLFFNINLPEKIKVLALNQANATYLPRIFNSEEFTYSQQSFERLNYSVFPEQQMIIVNELQSIPTSLTTALKSFSDNGGTLLIIPANIAEIESYNTLLAALQLGSFSTLIEQEKKITKIIFSHPLYQDVFEKRVINFQYPKVNSFYEATSLGTPILQFEDGKSFILQKGTSFLSAASFGIANSNFQSSPLIVPTLYNMAKQSLALPKLYYEIGVQNKFSIPIKLGKDQILTLKDSLQSFIPLQQTKATQVNITTENEPSKAGIYAIEKTLEYIESISYNYNRNESILNFSNPENWEGAVSYNSVEELVSAITKENTISSYWKWFVILALLFLLTEMMLLKFLKN